MSREQFIESLKNTQYCDLAKNSLRLTILEQDEVINDLERQLAEAREEVDYAIEFFNKNENFGVVGILKGIGDKLKEPRKC